MSERIGLIAGNGQLPGIVVAEAARRSIPLTVAAIKEETEPELEDEVLAHPGFALDWVGVGQLGKLLKVFHRDGVRRAIMVGQVRHVRIFAPGSKSPFSQLKHLPDLRMLKLLNSLRRRNTASLIEAVITELEQEGIEMLDSTLLLEDLLAGEGVLTGREPTEMERRDVEFGCPVARRIVELDIGQTLVVKDQAVVAVEAMEGTDAVIRRAARLCGGANLTLIKVSRPSRDRRFDVPVIGLATLEVLAECGVTAVAVDAHQTLLLDREALLAEATRLGISIVGIRGEPEE